MFEVDRYSPRWLCGGLISLKLVAANCTLPSDKYCELLTYTLYFSEEDVFLDKIHCAHETQKVIHTSISVFTSPKCNQQIET